MPLLRVLSTRIRESFKLLNLQNPSAWYSKQPQDHPKLTTHVFTRGYISYKIYLDYGSSLFP
jgi:hypothetical protein